MLTEIIHNEHFRTQYHLLPPDHSLARLVEWFWQSNYSFSSPVEERSLANLSHSLVFSLQSPFGYVQPGQAEEKHIGGHVFIGHRTQPLILRHYADNLLFGIKLRPGGFYRLFGFGPAELNNELAELLQLSPLFKGLSDRLMLSNGFEERVHISSRFLSDLLLQRDSHAWQKVQATLARFKAGAFLEKNMALAAKDAYCTPKSLYRYFVEVLGLPPKTCFKILRVRSALQAYVHQPAFNPWDFGYTDHSHFRKEVKAFTQEGLRGLKP